MGTLVPRKTGGSLILRGFISMGFWEFMELIYYKFSTSPPPTPAPTESTSRCQGHAIFENDLDVFVSEIFAARFPFTIIRSTAQAFKPKPATHSPIRSQARQFFTKIQTPSAMHAIEQAVTIVKANGVGSLNIKTVETR